MKKANSKGWNSENVLYLKYLYLSNKDSRIFYNSLIKSIICTIKHHKNVYKFLTSLDRWNKKKKITTMLKE